MKMTLRLIPYEIRKLLTAPLMRITAVALIVASAIVFIANVLDPMSTILPLRDPEYDKYADEIYNMAINDPDGFLREYGRVKKDYEDYASGKTDSMSASYSNGKYPDIDFFNRAYTYAMANDAYREKIGDAIARAESLDRAYGKLNISPDSYVRRYQRSYIERYKSLEESVTLGREVVRGWYKYFDYTADYFAVLLIAAVVAVYAALGDRSSGAYTVMSVCRGGRAHTGAAKYFAAMAVCALAAAVSAVISFAAIGVVTGGYSNPFSAVQSMTDLRFFPFRTSFLGAFLFDILLKAVTTAIFASVVFAVASAVKNAAIAAGVGLSLIAVGYYVPNLERTSLGQWKYLGLWSTFGTENFASEYRAVEIFGYPVTLGAVFAVIALVTAVLSVSVSAVLFHARGLSGSVGRSRAAAALERIKEKISGRRASARRYPSSLVSYEIYKQRAVYAILAVLIVAKVIAASGYFTAKESTFEKITKKYLDVVGGPYTEEKAEYIEKEYRIYSEKFEQLKNIGEEFWNNKISSEYYRSLLYELTDAQEKMEPLEYLRGQSDRLEKLYRERGIVGSYVYDIGYNKLMNEGVDWLLLVFVCVLACRMYLPEFKSSTSGNCMQMIANTTARGRGALFAAKTAVFTVSSAAAWTVFRAVDMFYFFRSNALPDNIYSAVLGLERYEGALPNLSIASYIALNFTLSFFGTLLLALICFLIGLYLRRELIVYTVTAAVAAVPYFIAKTGIAAAGYLDLTMLFDTDRLYRLGGDVLPMPICGMVFLTAAAAAAAALTVRAVRAVRRGDWLIR